MDNNKCPECSSTDVIFNEKKNEYLCKDCYHHFKAKKEFKPLRVFLSYGHDEHAELAKKLCKDLKNRGHNVWADDKIEIGEYWENEIEEGIEWVTKIPNKGRFILIMTPYSVRRPDGFCLNEITRAQERKLNIIPIMLVECEPPLIICRIQWLDMMDCTPLGEHKKNYETKKDRLIEALEENKIDFEGFQSKLVDVLDPLPFEAEIHHHFQRFTGRKWILDKINNWLDDSEASRIFWITGKPGTGKTALASFLCHEKREVVAFHLCQYGHIFKSDPRRCVLSIAYQLSTQLPEYMERLKKVDLDNLRVEHTRKMDIQNNAQTIFDIIIKQPLDNLPKPKKNIVILIDALDEATVEGQNELADFIVREFKETPEWLRLIITSRPDPNIVHILQDLKSYKLDEKSLENDKDIKKFLKIELNNYKPDGIPPGLIELISKKSEGNFLYLTEILEDLKNGNLSFDNIDEFPNGLGGFYAHLFKRQFSDIDIYKKNIRPALELISASQENLDIKLIMQILDWEEYDLIEFKDSVGSLFIYENDKIQPFHKSLMDWVSNMARAGLYYVSEKKGHEKISEIGWDEYILGAPKGAQKLSMYMLSYLPYHLEISHRKEELKQISYDMNFFVEIMATGFHEQYVEDDFRKLHDPVMKPWETLSEGNKEIFRSMAMDVPKKIQMLGYNIRYSPKPKETLLSESEVECIAEMEHERWMKLKIENGYVYGRKRDEEKKINPYLVSWNELTEEVKEWDREPVRKIPKIIENSGFEIFKSIHKLD